MGTVIVPAAMSGTASASTARAMRAFTSVGRMRSVEPVSVRRFTITGVKLNFSTIGPCRKAICTRRPSRARIEMFFGM